jgi:hypothetical protein
MNDAAYESVNDESFKYSYNLNQLDKRRIKKDALYKPLLRKFRNFLRKELDSYGLLKGCHYWNSDRMR